MPKLLPKKRLIQYPIPQLIGGLRYDLGTTLLKPGESPSMEEMRIQGRHLQKAPGVRLFASGLLGSVLFLKFINDTLFCHTTRAVYKWNPNEEIFENITDTDPAFLGADWDSDAAAWDTDTTVWDGAINYSGEVGRFISSVMMAGLYIWTNGADTPRKYDFTVASAEELAGATTYITKWLHVFGGRLCHYNLTEGGVDRPRRVRWSVVGDPEDYAGGGSGFTDPDTIEEGDEIYRAERLGNYIVIYSRQSLCLQEYTGFTNNPYLFSNRIPQYGLLAPRALVNLFGKQHFFLGKEDVYLYQGGRELVSIGKKVRDEIFDIINPGYASRSFMTHLRMLRKLRLFIPTGTSEIPNTYFELDLATGNWTRGSRTYTGCGEYERFSGLTWDTDPGVWDDDAGIWDSSRMLEKFESPLYGSLGGEVYEDDGSYLNHVSTPVVSWWDTKDFVLGEEYKESMAAWLELSFEGWGDSVDISASQDGGETYDFLETVSLENDWRSHRIGFSIYSNQVSFRFGNEASQETFRLRRLSVGVIPGSTRGVVQE